MQPISFDVHMVDKNGTPFVVTLPVGPAIEICAFCEGAVVKLVPNYVVKFGLPSLPDNSDKE